MIFARYIGESNNLFTKGRAYVARPEMDGTETVGFDFIEVTSDIMTRQRVRPDDDMFEYMDECYAVVVEPFDEWEKGDVVVIEDAVDWETAQGKFSIKDVGLYNATRFVLLDRTNVFPGIFIKDSSTGVWVPVKRVDECLWVMVNGGRIMRSPEEFQFAVSGRDLLTDPVATCIYADGYENDLTPGNIYRVTKSWEDMWTVIGDQGKPVEVDEGRFRMGA